MSKSCVIRIALRLLFRFRLCRTIFFSWRTTKTGQRLQVMSSITGVISMHFLWHQCRSLCWNILSGTRRLSTLEASTGCRSKGMSCPCKTVFVSVLTRISLEELSTGIIYAVLMLFDVVACARRLIWSLHAVERIWISSADKSNCFHWWEIRRTVSPINRALITLWCLRVSMEFESSTIMSTCARLRFLDVHAYESWPDQQVFWVAQFGRVWDYNLWQSWV